MERWTRIATVMFIVGLAITLVTAYDIRSVVVAHETLTFEEGYLQMGPYDPGHYSWSIWMEDYYEGFDEDNDFDVFASANPPGNQSYSLFPNRYVVREFDGVECEYMHSWDPWSWAGSGVYFGVEANEDPIGDINDTVEVFLVRSGSALLQLVFAVGLIIMLVGLIFLVASKWPKVPDQECHREV